MSIRATTYGTLTADTVADFNYTTENDEDSLGDANIYDTTAHHTLHVYYSSVEVVNRTGDAEIFFTTNGDDPEVEGDESYFVPAAVGASLKVAVNSQNLVVKLISSGTPDFAIEAK